MPGWVQGGAVTYTSTSADSTWVEYGTPATGAVTYGTPTTTVITCGGYTIWPPTGSFVWAPSPSAAPHPALHQSPAEAQAAERLERQHQERLDRYAQQERDRRERNRAAQERAEQLLRAWLTPAQLAEYDHGRGIPLRGSAGTRFRLTGGVVSNIWLYDDDEREDFGRCCVHPDGPLPVPDMHLGQLLALSTNEQEFLAVANWDFGRDEYRDRIAALAG